jgi:hypothetical protein
MEGCGNDLLGLRDGALLIVGEGMLCRSSVIWAIEVGNVLVSGGRPGQS